MSATAARRILLVVHPHRAEAHELVAVLARRLGEAGIEVVAALDEANQRSLLDTPGLSAAPAQEPATGCELICVLGGDGTILASAEISRGSGVPLLGVNFGHVGFLAEAEKDDLDDLIRRIVERDYAVEERMALEVRIDGGGGASTTSWALNEVSVEKASRERMIEVTLDIDSHPLSTWGCDGIIVASPTGSTAYAFSAGGPIVWPSTEALLVVPISAHALFARPLVVGPDSRLAVHVMTRSPSPAVVACDGRRTFNLPPGGSVEVTRSAEPVLLARFDHETFTERLVRKFELPVNGWRGAAPSGSGAP